jgi:hypothetical protein
MKKLVKAGSNLCPEEEVINHTNLLIDDEPLQVLPKLAVSMGLDEAIVIQQLHYWLNPRRKSGKVIGGRRWIYNTYKEWRETNFPFWSEIHIKRLFLNLEKSGVIVSCQPEGRMSRRKYYRLSDAFVLRAKRGEIDKPDGISNEPSAYPVDTIVVSKRSVPITETTSIDNKQRVLVEDTSNRGAGESESFPSYNSVWKPRSGTKEEKLAVIRPSSNYPSEAEFDRYLDSEALDNVISGRPDLYSQLCENKWHQWKEHLKKWVPINNWKAYVVALSVKINEDLHFNL